MLEDCVQEFPERVVSRRGVGSGGACSIGLSDAIGILGGQHRPGMNVGSQRKLLEGDAHLWKVVDDLVQDGLCRLAVRALEVAEGDDLNDRSCGAAARAIGSA